MKRILAAVLLLLASESSKATYIPTWFEPDQYFFSFEGGMGPGDIDRVTPIPHPELGGLTPGREWFAWIDVKSPGVAMSSWEGFELGTDHTFIGFLGSDTSSSPVSQFGPALNGLVRPDGGIYICITQTGDENCDHIGGFGNANDYSFFLALAPTSVPEPSSALLAIAALAVGFSAMRRRVQLSGRKVGQQVTDSGPPMP